MMAGDTTNANVDGSRNVTVGKHNTQNVLNDSAHADGDRNVQQVVHIGQDETHRDAEETHSITIRLLNDWLGRFEKRMDKESDERRKAQDELRLDVEEVKRIVKDMSSKFNGTIRLPYGHMQIFGMAFLMLYIATPLFLSDVRVMLGVSWQFVVLFTALAYAISAALWGYMWFGGRGRC